MLMKLRAAHYSDCANDDDGDKEEDEQGMPKKYVFIRRCELYVKLILSITFNDQWNSNCLELVLATSLVMCMV